LEEGLDVIDKKLPLEERGVYLHDSSRPLNFFDNEVASGETSSRVLRSERSIEVYQRTICMTSGVITR